jgi:hypothetical protein
MRLGLAVASASLPLVPNWLHAQSSPIVANSRIRGRVGQANQIRCSVAVCPIAGPVHDEGAVARGHSECLSATLGRPVGRRAQLVDLRQIRHRRDCGRQPTAGADSINVACVAGRPLQAGSPRRDAADLHVGIGANSVIGHLESAGRVQICWSLCMRRDAQESSLSAVDDPADTVSRVIAHRLLWGC